MLLKNLKLLLLAMSYVLTTASSSSWHSNDNNKYLKDLIISGHNNANQEIKLLLIYTLNKKSKLLMECSGSVKIIELGQTCKNWQLKAIHDKAIDLSNGQEVISIDL